MFTEVALVLVQLRTAVAPTAIVLGCALNVIVGAEPEDAVTLTTVEAAALPADPLAVAV
jgi:hypothetical protein